MRSKGKPEGIEVYGEKEYCLAVGGENRAKWACAIKNKAPLTKGGLKPEACPAEGAENGWKSL